MCLAIVGRLGLLTLATAVLVAAWLLPASPQAGALFGSNRTASGNTFAAASMFFATRTTSTHELRDFSSGTETGGVPDKLADPDGVTQQTTKGWPTAFDTNKYVEMRFAPSLPTGFSIANARIELTFEPVANGDTFCAYIDTYKISTGAYDGSFRTAANPWCTSGPLAVTLGLSGTDATTQYFNDLAIRIVGKVGTAGNKVQFDDATLRGSMITLAVSTPVVQHVDTLIERQDGVSSDQSYYTAQQGDGRAWTTSSGWPTTRSATRYLSAAFPWTGRGHVPSNARVEAVTLYTNWRPSGAGNACYDLQIYLGTTLVDGTDQANPSCHGAGSGTATDTWDISHLVTTPADINGLNVRFHYRSNDGITRTVHDWVAVAVKYGID